MFILLIILSSNLGISGELSDTLKVKQEPFWEKVGFGIGYSGGLYWTGDDLAKPFEASPVAGPGQLPEYLGAHLYWLNSIEGSITYPVNEGWGIEIGFGYGWTDINKHSSLSYDITNFLFSLGLTHNKHIMSISYIDAHTTKITGGEFFHYYHGEGKGYEISYRYQINKIIGLNINVGEAFYTIIQEDNEYEINQCLNGVGLFLDYKFNFCGG